MSKPLNVDQLVIMRLKSDPNNMTGRWFINMRERFGRKAVMESIKRNRKALVDE